MVAGGNGEGARHVLGQHGMHATTWHGITGQRCPSQACHGLGRELSVLVLGPAPAEDLGHPPSPLQGEAPRCLFRHPQPFPAIACPGSAGCLATALSSPRVPGAILLRCHGNAMSKFPPLHRDVREPWSGSAAAQRPRPLPNLPRAGVQRPAPGEATPCSAGWVLSHGAAAGSGRTGGGTGGKASGVQGPGL